MSAASPPLLGTFVQGRTTSRERRVYILVTLMIMLGLGDLYATVMHAFYFGMGELNPIARWLINAGDPLALILFKLGTMGVAVGLLLKARHRPSGEIGCWLLALVLVALTLYWHQYHVMLDSQLAGVHYSEVGEQMRIVSSSAAP